jgi:DNA-binding response OmpR family regulator
MALFRKRRIADINPSIPFGEIKKRVRILVIDDDPNSFPLDAFKNEGYAIEHWQTVKTLERLERGDYDIIILDIVGVSGGWSPDDGLGILEHIKATNPSQVVVAFSGMSFDLSKNRFWRLADDSLAKPVDAAKCKRLVDGIIKDKLTIQHYWAGVTGVLKNQGLSDRAIDKLEAKVVKALEDKDKRALERLLSSAVDKVEVAGKLAVLAAKLGFTLGL